MDDYVRDPVDHADFEIRAADFLGEIANTIAAGRFHPAPSYPLPLAKGKGISRPTVSLDLNDLLVYRAVVESLETRLLRKVPAAAFHGGRLLPNPGIADFYERWWENWSRYQAYLKRLKRRGYRTFVISDIAAYFEQIDLHLLRDMVAHECPGKKNLVDLLFYLLESKTPRDYYARNTFRGLPQENFDCSRELAYFFLHPVDLRLQTWCRQNRARYARWVDDFNIAVRRRSAAKHALGELTHYLRQLHLSASVEKTLILSGSEIDRHFYFRENERLDRVHQLLQSKRARDRRRARQMLRDEYRRFRRKTGGNWKKVMKRFYTYFAWTRSRRLVGDVPVHLIEYPDLAKKIFEYLAALRFDRRVFREVRKYLYSDENLYPGVEAEALEFLLLWPIPDSNRDRQSVVALAKAVLLGKAYTPKSPYAGALAAMLIYKFGSAADLAGVVDHYLGSTEGDQLLRKYLVAVSITSQVQDQADKVLAKARLDPSPTVKRLVEFVDYLRVATRVPPAVGNKLQPVKLKYSGLLTLHSRRLLLAHLLFKYCPAAIQLRPRMHAIRDAVRNVQVRYKINSFA